MSFDFFGSWERMRKLPSIEEAERESKRLEHEYLRSTSFTSEAMENLRKRVKKLKGFFQVPGDVEREVAEMFEAAGVPVEKVQCVRLYSVSVPGVYKGPLTFCRVEAGGRDYILTWEFAKRNPALVAELVKSGHPLVRPSREQDRGELGYMFEPGFDPRLAALIQARFASRGEEAVEVSERLADLMRKAWRAFKPVAPFGWTAPVPVSYLPDLVALIDVIERGEPRSESNIHAFRYARLEKHPVASYAKTPYAIVDLGTGGYTIGVFLPLLLSEKALRFFPLALVEPFREAPPEEPYESRESIGRITYEFPERGETLEAVVKPFYIPGGIIPAAAGKDERLKLSDIIAVYEPSSEESRHILERLASETVEKPNVCEYMDVFRETKTVYEKQRR